MHTTTVDGPALVPLGETECRHLLATAAIGRVGLSIDALPVVLPVSFVVDGDRIVFRTGAGAKLQQALQHAVVCFEVDDVDPIYHSGWSVLVTGQASEITDGIELERARLLPLRPWGRADAQHFVQVRIELISGRRIGGVG